MKKIILIPTFLSLTALWILGSLLYIWTVIIAFNVSGLVGAIITFIMPVISQLYWCYKAFRSSGFNNAYIQWMIVFVLIYIIHLFFSILSTSVSKK